MLEQNQSRIQSVLEKRWKNKLSTKKALETSAYNFSSARQQVIAPGRSKPENRIDEDQNPDVGPSPQGLLQHPHKCSDAQLLSFERLGHICTRSLLSRTEVAALSDALLKEVEARHLTALSHRMRVLLPADKQVPVQSREMALQHLRKHSKELGFLQYFNLHRYITCKPGQIQTSFFLSLAPRA